MSYIAGEEVMLNVSGSKFRIHESYLNQHPETLLGSKERNFFYDEEEKEYFFDRDPYIFRFIHKYYKTGKLHFSEVDCYESFADELNFFRIKKNEISSCCNNSYALRLMKKMKEDDVEKVEKKRTLTTPREICWDFLENPSHSILANLFYYFSCLVIIVSVAVQSAETVNCENASWTNETSHTNDSKRCKEVYSDIFFIVETICVGFFTLEYLFRLYASPIRYNFIKNKLSIIDILATLPYFLDLTLMAFEVNTHGRAGNLLDALRSIRIVRICKLARHSKRLKSLSSAIVRSSNELGFIVFMYIIVVTIFASVIYYAENMDGSSQFVSIPEAMWYTVVTTTTLG